MEMIGFLILFPLIIAGLLVVIRKDEATQHNRMCWFRCYRHSIYCLGCNEHRNNWYVFRFPVGHR